MQRPVESPGYRGTRAIIISGTETSGHNQKTGLLMAAAKDFNNLRLVIPDNGHSVQPEASSAKFYGNVLGIAIGNVPKKDLVPYGYEGTADGFQSFSHDLS
jgi:hypothetical protein